MDDILYTVIISIIVAIIGGVIGWFKRTDYDTKFQDIYVKYKLIFDISGTIIEALDAQLYEEFVEALNKMKEAYESPEFSNDMFDEIVKECKDVLDRIDELLAERKNKVSDTTTETETVTDGEAETETAEDETKTEE